MAEDYVAKERSIWGDDDWRELTVQAQHLYDLLLTHPDRGPGGLLSLTPKKWTRLARGLTVSGLREALAELDQAGFVVVDEDTEEVLVRSYIRRGKVFKHHRLLMNALREVAAVESERIRSALGQELVRIPRLVIPEPNGRNDRAIAEAHQAQERLDELASQMCDAPPEPPGQSTDLANAHGMPHGMGHPLPHPPGVGVGTGVGAGAGAVGGSWSSTENESLESIARAKPPPLTGLCAIHPGQPARSCSGCAADRKAAS